jgi:Tfp pilus assembly protein PilF
MTFSRQFFGLLAVLSVLLVTIYPALHIPFILDDHAKIILNTDVHALTGIWNKLVYPYGPSTIATRNDPSRPLVYLIYTLLYAGWSANPLPFHAVNLLFHGINGLLFALLIRRIFLGIDTDHHSPNLFFTVLFGALFFLLTPMNVATAAYIYGLSDVLSLSFILIALLCHSYSDERPLIMGIFSGIATLLSLGSKQIGVITPFIFVLYDFFIRSRTKRDSKRPTLLSYGPSCLVVVSYLIWRLFYFGRMGDLEGSTYVKPLFSYVLAQPHAVLHYVIGSFIPYGLCLDHDLPYPPLHLWEHAFKTIVVLSLLTGGTWILWRQRSQRDVKLALFGLFFFLVWIAPTSSVLSTVDYVVERRSYGGSIGLTLGALAAGLAMDRHLKAQHLRKFFWLLCIPLYCGFLAYFSHQRLQHMQSEKDLWIEILSRYPTSYRALGNLANTYIAERNFVEAEGSYKRLLTILPDHATTFVNMGFVYANQLSPLKDVNKAKAFFTRGLELDPRIAEAWHNLGLLALEEGSLREAERLFQKAIEVDPRHIGAYNQLCALMIDQKRMDEARRYLDISRSLVPTHPMVLENQARISGS